MNQQQGTEISDADIILLVKLSQERASEIGASGEYIGRAIADAAIRLQGVIDRLHDMANDPRLQEKNEG